MRFWMLVATAVAAATTVAAAPVDVVVAGSTADDATPGTSTSPTTTSADSEHFDFIRSQLEAYGYLQGGSPSLHEFAEALKKFQEVLDVPATGLVDEETVSAASQPRCAQPDQHRSSRRNKRFTMALQSKWNRKHFTETGELHLKWYISSYTTDIDKSAVRSTVKKAFQLWATQTNVNDQKKVTMRFEEAASQADSDINILWAEGDHGDPFKFVRPDDKDPNNKEIVLAHTFFPAYPSPLNGDIHFDDGETWEVDVAAATISGRRFFPYVLAHEIGHALGLHHSRKQEAIMYPYYKSVPLDEIVFDVDDKCGINWNYAGSSPFCLFVWLMSEIVPNPRYLEENGRRGTSSQQRLQVKSNLKNLKIPRCSSSHEDQLKIGETEKKLSKNLQLNAEDTKKYTEVLCNFLAGLHMYRSRPSYVPNESIEREYKGVREEVLSFTGVKNRMLRHVKHDCETGGPCLLDPNFYDEAFFDEFFDAYLTAK